MTGRMTATAVLAITIIFSAAMIPAQDSNPALTLQRAIDLVESQGDWNSAIPLFEAASGSADPAIAVRALLYLGQRQERTDPAQARLTYERITQDFAGQAGAVTQARSRLVALPTASARTEAESTGPAAKFLWASDDGDGLKISPDGRYSTFVDWTGKSPRPGNSGDLGVMDIQTGEYVLVGLTGTSRDEGGDTYVGTAAWSRDGSQLAYADWASTWDHRILHIVNADGSGHRIVSDNLQNRDLRAEAWSSDRAWILCLVMGWDEVWRIATISTEDGSVTFLKTLRSQLPGGPRPFVADGIPLALSPDDRYIAYSYAPSPPDPEDIWVLAVDGSYESVVAPNPATDRDPRWTPDGSRLVFLSDRSGTADLWAVEMSDGRAMGTPKVIRSRVGPIWLDRFTDDGALTYISGGDPGAGLQLVSVPGTNGSTTLDQPLTERFRGRNSEPTWSPDGSRVAYISTRPTPGLDRPERYLVVKSMAGGEERDIELPPFFAPLFSRPAWSEDGRRILLNGGLLEQPETETTTRVPLRGFSVDLESGEVQLESYVWDHANDWGDWFVSERQNNRLRELGIRIVGRTLRAAIANRTEPLRPGEKLLWMWPGRTGTPSGPGWLKYEDCDPEQSYPNAECLEDGMLLEPIPPHGPIAGYWELSPDGSQLAYINREKGRVTIWVRSVTMDGEPTLVDSRPVPEDERVSRIRWMPDGRHVLYGFYPQSDGQPDYSDRLSSIYKVNVEDGKSEALDWAIGAEQLIALAFDPDGRRAIIAERDTNASPGGVWTLSGFPWDAE